MAVNVAVVRASASTAASNQDFTTTDLGGLTPKAALFIVASGVTDGTPRDHLKFSVGAAASAKQWAIAVESEHGQASSDDGSRGSNAHVIIIIDDDPATDEATATFNSFITNGVRITWDNAPTNAYLVTVVLFAGDELSANATVEDVADAIDGTVDVTGIAFEPDIVITAARVGAIGSLSGDAHMKMALGLVHNNGAGTVTQRSLMMFSRDNQPNVALSSRITESYGYMNVSQTGTLTYGIEFGSFDSSGFTMTTRVGAPSAADKLGCLSLKFANHSSWVGTVDSPTATGNDSKTGPGFQPQFVLQMLTAMPQINTAYVDDNSGSWGISVIDETESYSNTVTSDDANTTSDTESLSDNQAINLHDAVGSPMFGATFSSFGASGWTLNFTSACASSSPRKWLAFAVAASTAGAVSERRAEFLFLQSDRPVYYLSV